ncbi:TPA: pYEATS domain-containing protein [Pseudomonas aeruginosa]
MSHNFSASQPLYTLSLCTRPGIAIRLLNSNLKEITRGSGKLETKQPEGLYLVQWSSGGLQSETMVRLDGSQEITELRFDPSDTATDTAPHSGDHIALALIDAVSNALEPIKGSQESTIVLIVTGDAEPLNDISALRLRLFDRNDVAMRRDSGRFIKLDLGSDERAYIYHVKPGRFHIGFQSILKERLGQSVPALAGRQTLIFLTAARAKLIVPNNGKFVKEVGIGIDPAKTVIVTVRGDEEKYRVRERVRLASLLLYDIANQTNSLSRDVVSVLDDNQTDPMLRLYGALVALSTLKRDERSRISHESNLVGEPADSSLRWGAHVRNWISNPGQAGLPTDAIAAYWELARTIPEAIGKGPSKSFPVRIETPPMLDRAWLWAIEESTVRPDAIRGTAQVAAATRSSGGTAPWLCWRLSASTARPRRSSVTDDLTSLTAQVVDKLNTMANPSISRSVASVLKILSPEAQATALRALQIMSSNDRLINASGIADLAVSLGLPAQQLRNRLDKISKTLDKAASGTDQEELSLSEKYEAPALLRRVIDRDDLQKGRFGGKASCAEFKVSAEFDAGSAKNWVRIRLYVEGPGTDGEKVEFHLHDSFKPSAVMRRFKKGAAQLLVSAWGGFTVGIWIPSHKVELELNLATLETAPRVIRER